MGTRNRYAEVDLDLCTYARIDLDSGSTGKLAVEDKLIRQNNRKIR